MKNLLVRPLNFVECLKKGDHALLFFDDEDYARSIELNYLKTGLNKGEFCVYITKDPETVYHKMRYHKINVESYITHHLLQIFLVAESNKGLISLRNKISDLFSLKLSIRVVIHDVFKPSFSGVIDKELEQEENIHKIFSQFPGSMICTHSVKDIDANRRNEVIVSLLKHHHCAIFAPRESKGYGFYL